MRIELLKKELLFPETQEYFKACHASTFIEAPNGDYVVAYFAGDKEGSNETGIWVSICHDEQWLRPVRIKYNGVPHWNPVLFRNGKEIVLFYKAGVDTHTWQTYRTSSFDDGRTWSRSTLLCPEDPGSRGPVRNKLVIGNDGSWIAPGSVETDSFFDAVIEKSFDCGETWTKHPIPVTHRNGSSIDMSCLWEGLIGEELWENNLSTIKSWDGVIQPALWYSEDGVLHAFMRSTRGSVYRSDSGDDGETWCEAYEIGLPNNNAAIDAVKTKYGQLIVACNPVSGNWAKRTPMSLFVSQDDGRSFEGPFHLETRKGELSYPSLCVIGEELHVTFTYLRKSIMHCVCAII